MSTKIKFLDNYKRIRKPALPTPKIFSPKKEYDRHDKSWMEDLEEDLEINSSESSE